MTAPFAPLLNDRATILMLHRFQDDDTGVDGLAPEALASGLAWLRRHGYELIRLDEMFRRLAGDGPPLKRTVAFTIDDGYYDHALVAAPVFARYDCPSTTFATTGFVDGTLWMWWDRVEFVFETTVLPALRVKVADAEVRYELSTPDARRAATQNFAQRCISVSDDVKQRAIDELARAADVDIPAQAPARYRAMTWDELRAAERLGMNFAPHTVTHPVLSRTTDAQSRREIVESWERLRAEAVDPVNIFAYPNGSFADFGQREVDTLRELGFAGACVGVGGYTSASAFRRDLDERFQVRRFGYMPDLPHLIQQVSGVERFKQILRAEDAA